MPLHPYAIITDPDEVWEYMMVAEPERVQHARLMETWINMGTVKIERYLNRPVVPRVLTDQKHDGNDRRVMYTKESPVLDVLSLTILDRTLDDPIAVDVSPASTEIDVDLKSGRLTLLTDAEIGFFRRGAGNIRITYTPGFDEFELDVFKQALIELISIRWEERGRNPLEQNRTDIVEGTNSFQKQPVSRLPFETTSLIDHFRKVRI